MTLSIKNGGYAILMRVDLMKKFTNFCPPFSYLSLLFFFCVSLSCIIFIISHTNYRHLLLS